MLSDLGYDTKKVEVDYEARPVEAPTHPHNVFLWNYVLSRADIEGITNRRDINPADLVKVMGGITIIEPVDDGRDLRYRLVGSENEQRLGIKLNGRRYTECYGTHMASEQIIFTNELLAAKKPQVLVGRFLGLGLEHAVFEVIYLVVRADSGDLQILTGMFEIKDSNYFD